MGKSMFLTVRQEDPPQFIPLIFMSKKLIDHKLQILRDKTAGSRCEAETEHFKTKAKVKLKT